MPLASIDVGSNSIRLLIGEVDAGCISAIRHERAVTRLAAGIAKSGLIGESSAEKTIQALKRFSEVLRDFRVRHVKAVGTSALREAGNSGDFILRVLRETGIKIEVISGEKEAELTQAGVLSSITNAGCSLIIDIGGGSTEWIFSDDKGVSPNDKRVLDWDTMPVGVVKLHERHIRSDPPLAADISSLEAGIEAVTKVMSERLLSRIGSTTALIATAGTATTLAAIDLKLDVYDRSRVHMHEIPLERLIEMEKTLLRLPLRERSHTPGLEPGRADLIIPGIHFTITLMKTLGFKKITISDDGLLEGAMLELSKEVQD